MFEELSKLFERYEGKQITKRMATAIEKEHPDWTVYYKPDYGMYQINIWGGDSGRDYNHYWQFFLGYESQGGIFTLEHFKDTNAGYGSAAEKRNIERRRMLAHPEELEEMARTFVAWKEAEGKWKSAMRDSYYNPSFYSVQRVLGLIK